MSRKRSRALSTLIASALVGVSMSGVSAEEASAKRKPAAAAKSKGDVRADARRSYRPARAAGRKVG